MRDLREVVHGGDFTFSATGVGTRKVQAKMRDWYDAKVREIEKCWVEHSDG